jgi:hypothetical protein
MKTLHVGLVEGIGFPERFFCSSETLEALRVLEVVRKRGGRA